MTRRRFKTAPRKLRSRIKKKALNPRPRSPAPQKLRRTLVTCPTSSEFIRQISIPSRRRACRHSAIFSNANAETPFLTCGVTCVHIRRADAPFEIVYNLYSISTGARVRLKAAVNDVEGIESVTSVWPAANWMEREVFDLFGVNFRNHPDLRRILLPPEWEGHPLRKEYPLEFVGTIGQAQPAQS